MNGALNLHPKVTASLLGGWVTVLILYSADHWGHVNPPSFVSAAVLGVVTFACGYLAPVAGVEAAAPPPAS
jgi:hypothetical protein